MCGLTGFWDPKGHLSRESYLSVISKMKESLSHRGPYDSGVFIDEYNGLALGHQRLAIQDLSQQGHQPMMSQNKRYVIIYNGEIYNSKSLVQKISHEISISFQGHSDTEVLIEAISHWGISKTLKEINGMFAFAVWDKETSQIFLARDRVGIKPLYWGFFAGILLFASELKSFQEFPGWPPQISEDAKTLYFQYGYIPTPYSIYQNIFKLFPGTFLSINKNNEVLTEKYWDFASVVQAREVNSMLSTQDAIEHCHSLCREAVEMRLLSDVPVGCFLSGGIDSSLVAALMQDIREQPIDTFSIGFKNKVYNEATYAKQIAMHLETLHHELYIEGQDALHILPNMVKTYDEPFADSSQIPCLLLSEFSKKNITVALSGDGGDEVFAGYNRYIFGQRIWSLLNKFPKWSKSLSRGAIGLLSPKAWDRLSRLLPKKVRPSLLGEKMLRLMDALEVETSYDFYQKLVTLWHRSPFDKNLPMSSDSLNLLTNIGFKNNVEEMQYFDTLTYLPDDILVKMDRATMAFSLEARVPLLDYRLVEYAWSLPFENKIYKGQSKWILRKILEQYVPRNLFERPKMGFGIPLADWLREDFYSFASKHLNTGNLSYIGLNPQVIMHQWKQHLDKKQNWHSMLWAVIMYSSWYHEHHQKSFVTNTSQYSHFKG